MIKFIIIGFLVALSVLIILILYKRKNSYGDKSGTDTTKISTFDYANLFNNIKNKIRELTTVNNLSYEDAMNYFIHHKKDNSNAIKGAMLKEEKDGTIYFTQVFLDKDNEIILGRNGVILGRKLKVAQLDKELLNTFKKENLVIVE
jgi:hypothetical protein